MSDNKFNNKFDDMSQTTGNLENKYNEENESINVTYEDIDTCILTLT